MTRGLVVYRRDLPGGRIAILSLDEAPDGTIAGRLHLERRSDPSRRREGEPPVVAEVHGATREAVLAALKRIAESDGELARRYDDWQRARRGPDSSAGAPRAVASEVARRMRMPDGEWWSAERRHEMTQLQSARGISDVRRLFMFFRGPGGVLRRAEVPEGFPPADEADEAALREAWRGAETLRQPSAHEDVR